MSSLLTNMTLTSASASPNMSPMHMSLTTTTTLPSGMQMTHLPSSSPSSMVDLDRLVIEEDAMSTISSESDNFVHLSSEGGVMYQTVDQCLLEFPGAMSQGSRASVSVARQAMDDVEMATDVLDDASFANPPTPSDDLPSSFVRRKDVVRLLGRHFLYSIV